MAKVGVFGISGVGKSTLIESARSTINLKHLQASNLIKARIARGAPEPTSEELRLGSVLANQRLMIDEFLEEASGTKAVVIFDGHTVIDGAEGLLEVPIQVFRELGLNAIIFVEDEPSKIAERRSSDASRIRPARDSATLETHQSVAAARAQEVAKDLGVPFKSIRPGDRDEFARILSKIGAGQPLDY